MRRALGLGPLAAALAAAPAGAAVPGPTVFDFENQDPGTFTDATYPNESAILRDGDTGCGEVFAAGVSPVTSTYRNSRWELERSLAPAPAAAQPDGRGQRPQGVNLTVITSPSAIT